MKIYCAGKIYPGDWRTEVLHNERVNAGVGDAQGICPTGLSDTDHVLPDSWPTTPIDAQHAYVGPYFLRCDHGCFHGPNSHGVGAQEVGRHQAQVIKLCQQAIEICDLFYAWLDVPDAYGTLVEIGYAVAFNKVVVIAGPRYLPDLWFAYQTARKTFFGRNLTPVAGLHKAIQLVAEGRRTW